MRIPFTNKEIRISGPETNAASTARPYKYNAGEKVLLPFQGVTDRDFTITTERLFALYKANGDMFGCIRERFQNVGLNGWNLRYTNDYEKSVSDSEFDRIKMIYKKSGGYHSLKRSMIRDMLISGNAYAHKRMIDNRLIALDRIDPRTMIIVATDTGEVVGYIQKVGLKEPIYYGPEEIVHFRTEEDFDSPLFGMSPIIPVYREAVTDNEAVLTNFALFKNGGIPAAVFMLEKDLSPEEKQIAIETLKTQLKGSSNRGKSIAVDGIKEIKQPAQSHKEMDFLNGRTFTTEKICSAYGVPKFLLGYTDTVNNNNGTELLRKFYQGTIRPDEVYFDQVMTEVFFEETSELEYYSLPQSFDEQEALERRGLAELAAGAITRRQYKQKTGQDITDSDEKQENFDAYILQQGQGATLLEDVGLDFDPNLPL